MNRRKILAMLAVLLMIFTTGCSQTGGQTEGSGDAGSAGSGKEEQSGMISGYEDHGFMNSRDFGACGKMVGNIDMILVFVSDSKSHWSDDEVAHFCECVSKDGDILEQQAADWGASLDFSYGMFRVDVPSDQEDNWYKYLMQNFFMHKDGRMETLQEYYEESTGYDDAPVLFIFNTEGRCYSYMGTEDNRYRDEYPVYYAKSMGTELSITHEFLHLYGAHDYYYPESVLEIAKKYFPDCSMVDGGRKVDDLSAYLIGWTDTLTDDARDFLSETSFLTAQGIEEAKPGIDD